MKVCSKYATVDLFLFFASNSVFPPAPSSLLHQSDPSLTMVPKARLKILSHSTHLRQANSCLSNILAYKKHLFRFVHVSSWGSGETWGSQGRLGCGCSDTKLSRRNTTSLDKGVHETWLPVLPQLSLCCQMKLGAIFIKYTSYFSQSSVLGPHQMLGAIIDLLWFLKNMLFSESGLSIHISGAWVRKCRATGRKGHLETVLLSLQK